MHLFYTPNIESSVYQLDEEESKHAIRVLRLVMGSEIVLLDGVGGYYTAEIIDAHPKRATVEIKSKIEQYSKRNVYLHIAIAPTKNMDRLEWFVEKATEIGIDEITPIICKNSERTILRTDRIEKVAISAMKQSIKAYKPTINEAITFDKFIIQKFDGAKTIAHCYDLEKIALKEITPKQNSVLILIGPEGDFTIDEVSLANSLGFESISLGNSRLRTETAATIACHTINLLFE